jgi:hypothetical protein
MRLLSWNCRGLGNPCTVRELLLLVKEQVPSVLFLSETRLDCIGVEILRVKLKMGSAFCVPRVHTGGGLAMIWTTSVEVQINSFSQNHIDAEFMDKAVGRGFRITGFYGNLETHRCKESWALLKHVSHLSSTSSWLCMGNFIEVLEDSERMGRGCRPGWQIQDFRDAVTFCELHDIGYVGSSFTWRKKRGGGGVVVDSSLGGVGTCAAARLDRMFASVSWM